MLVPLLILSTALAAANIGKHGGIEVPEFGEPITNLTVAIGRDATFECIVVNLGNFRVGWVKADTKAIQAIHEHVITHNPRVSVSHSDHSTWYLHIKNVQEEDRGQYMCQINITATDVENLVRVERALRKDYEYENYEFSPPEMFEDKDLPDAYPTGLQGNDSEWYFTGARLFPNVKGCGYPPILNCTIFYGKYRPLGNNYTCYYSRVDPGLVITELDMWQNTLNLVYAMAIPIPSFIISVIYLTFAYFKIYNTEEESEQEPLKNDAEAMATGDDEKPTTPGSDTFREDLARFGHQLKMQLANDNPKEGFESNSPPISNSASLSGTKSSFVNA